MQVDYLYLSVGVRGIGIDIDGMIWVNGVGIGYGRQKTDVRVFLYE